MLSFANKTQYKSAMWNCICECGKNTTALSSQLKRGFKKSCGCLKAEHTLSEGESSLNAVFRRYQNQAKKRDIVFSLTKEQFYRISQEPCYYCNRLKVQKYARDRGNGAFEYNGIDRVNNNKGYKIQNCVSCCGLCNIMKHDLHEQEFYEHIRKIIENKEVFYE